MTIDWNIILSAITICVALIALRQTSQQIKLSNKQHLFDKRMENYLIAKGLIELYRGISIKIDDKKDEPIFAVSSYFTGLTNNTYLEQITPAINNTLKEPSHKALLVKLESLKEVATRIKFLLSDEASVLLSDFVFRYQELLFSMYQYQIVLDKMSEINKANPLTTKEAQKQVGEEEYRIELKKAFDNLKQAESLLKKENVEEQIKKQIKLY